MLQRFLTHKQMRRLVQLLTFILVVGLLVTPSVALADVPISGPVVVRPGGAQLYSAPNGDVVENLPIGTVVTVSGRTGDDQWLVGVAPDGKIGWVQVAQMIAVGVDLLPVYDDSSGVTTTVVPANVVASNSVSTTVTQNTVTQNSVVPNTVVPNATVANSAGPDTTVPNAPSSGDTANNPAASTATLTEQPSVSQSAQAAQLPAAASATTTAPSGAAVIGTVASGTDRLNIRSGPGIDFSIVDHTTSGAQYAVTGRSEDGTWLQITLNPVSAGEASTGWISASYVTLQGDPTSLPVVAVADPPSPALVPASLTQTAVPSSAAVSGLSGTLVIETSPGGMMYGYSLDNGSLWPLTNGFDPAISPDGKTVAFVRDGGDNGIYLINIDGSNEHLIFSGRARLSSPKWSPDGQYISFTRGDGTYHCIATGRSCVTPRGGGNGGGSSIPGLETQTRSWNNLARVDRDGNNYRDIPSLTSAKAGDWNQAGIVYESTAGLQITADTPDDQNRLVIFDYLKPYFSDPDWQPNGGKLVYMGKEASHWELFAVNPDGSGKVALTQPETTVVDVIPSNVAPAWSPDGKHIAFLSNREDNHEAGKWRVWVMDADGSNQHPLPINLDINYTFGDEQSVDWTS